jgi:hypothetical protein
VSTWEVLLLWRRHAACVCGFNPAVLPSLSLHLVPLGLSREVVRLETGDAVMLVTRLQCSHRQKQRPSLHSLHAIVWCMPSNMGNGLHVIPPL